MDRQDQRKRAFSQAFQLVNQHRLGESNGQVAKRISSYPFGATALYPREYNQENEEPPGLDYSSVLEPIPGTQIRHPPPADLQYANPALYNYASLQFELYGNGSGPELHSNIGVIPSSVAPKRQFEGPVFREAPLSTPPIVRGKSMFGSSPYVRPDYDSSLDDMLECYTPPRPGPVIYEDGDLAMSDATTAVGPLTPSALNFGNLSLNTQGYSLPPSPLQDRNHGSRATVRVMPISSFAGLFPEIKPNEVIILFDKGREVRRVDKYPLCSASRFFANFLDGPFLDPSLTRCIRLRDDFPYAITTLLHFVETGNYMWDPQAFKRHPRLTTLDFNVHSYLVGSKYGVSALRGRAMDAYLRIAAHELKSGLCALSGGRLPDTKVLLPGYSDTPPAECHADEAPRSTPMDRFLDSLVLLWKNTPSRSDTLRTAVLELIKQDLSKLLQLPFFVTLMTQLVEFGDNVVASLSDDGFDVTAFQVPTGGGRAVTMRFDV